MATRLVVCVTCRQGRELAPGEVPPGRLLHDALVAREAGPDAPRIEEVSCLVACGRGCTAVLMGDGKWSVLLGGLDADRADDLLEYARLYDAHASGMVLPSRRPESLRAAVLGRVPG